MAKPLSFFRLTTPRPAPDTDNPLVALTGEEFEAAQREGRPMRSNWSWERRGYSDWQGDLP